MLGAPLTLAYNTGSPDTLPALTPGVVDGSVPMDCTSYVFVGYTVLGSNVLSVALESALPNSGTYALLCRVLLHSVDPYQEV